MHDLLRLSPPADPEQLLGDADLKIYRRLTADPRYKPLVELLVLAEYLTHFAWADLETLVAGIGGPPDLGTGDLVQAIRDDTKRYEAGHAVAVTERVREYMKGAVGRLKSRQARQKVARRLDRHAARFVPVPCGLPAPVARNRPVLLVGSAQAVRLLIDHVVATALGAAQPPKVFHLWYGRGSAAPGAGPAEWNERLHLPSRTFPEGTDLLVVDHVLHGIKPQGVGRLDGPGRTRTERGMMALRKLEATARNHAVAVVAGYYWDDAVDRDDAAYREMKGFADSYRVERAGAELVVYDADARPCLTVPLRRHEGAA